MPNRWKVAAVPAILWLLVGAEAFMPRAYDSTIAGEGLGLHSEFRHRLACREPSVMRAIRHALMPVAAQYLSVIDQENAWHLETIALQPAGDAVTFQDSGFESPPPDLWAE